MHERIKELLVYNADTGDFSWRVTRGRSAAGKIAGRLTKLGYRQIKVDGVYHLAHRLAWLYVYGMWPELHIDHINRIKDDNRIENLRDVTRSENMRNVVYKKRATHQQVSDLQRRIAELSA